MYFTRKRTASLIYARYDAIAARDVYPTLLSYSACPISAQTPVTDSPKVKRTYLLARFHREHVGYEQFNAHL